MGLIEATKSCFSKYATFSGRASRPEYWWFYLAVMLVSLFASAVDFLLFGGARVDVAATTDAVVATASAEARSEPLTAIWGLIVLLPLLAAGWRRAHDSGKPGWYVLLPGIAAVIGVFGLFLGVAGFGLLESLGADPDRLRGAAAILGTGGMLVLAVVVIALSIYKIVLMIRPSDPAENEYGLPPSS
jgi:uncharacterized membrane protein YhaH (DUF805 family)